MNISKCDFLANNKLLSESKKKSLVKMFHDSRNYAEQERNELGRWSHPLSAALVANTCVFNLISDKPLFALIMAVFGYMQMGLDKMFHNIAMRKSQDLVRFLKSKSMTDENHLTEMVDYYLKRHGGLVYSNFVRKFQYDKIEAVAKGEFATQIKGLMTFLRDKYTLLTPKAVNKAQAVKRKNNINRLFNS